MSKNHSSRLKKKIIKKINPVNGAVLIVSLLAGYTVVNVLAFAEDTKKQDKIGELVYSVDRLADSFEFYNQKRFITER